MSCREVQQEIDLYLDEAITVARRVELEEHFRTCSGCRTSLARARHLAGVLRELPAFNCPDETVQRIYAQTLAVRRGVPQRSGIARNAWRGRRLAPRPALAGWLCMLLLLISSFFLARQNGGPVEARYTAAQVLQTKSQINKAFQILFKAVNKSARITRDQVMIAKVVSPARAGMRHIAKLPTLRGVL